MRRFSLISALFYLAALALPCIIVLAALFVLDMYPFGDKALSVWDLRITYTYFYEWFRDVLLGNGNLFYSFSKSLGGNMYADWACLLVSPLNWLVVFFGDNPMDFVTFMIVVKFGLAGLTAYFYIRRRFTLSRTLSLALSLCYAMMMFMTTQSANPMWMEAVIVLPLVLYGIFCLVHQGKVILFFVSLLASIALNFYNGYMICLFSILFYLFESYLAAPQSGRARLKVLVNPGRFVGTFTLAVLASAVILLPTALGLLAGKGAVPGGLFDLGTRYDLNDVFRSLYLGVYEKELLPQLYSGTLTLICVVWYFFNRKIGRREKVAAAVFIGLMVFSTWFAPFDRIWLGLRDGSSFYCRFTFLISALLIFVAARCLGTLGKDAGTNLLKAAVIVAFAAVIIFADGNFMRYRYFFATVALCVALPVLLILIYSNREARIAKVVFNILLILAVSCEGLLSCYSILQYRLKEDYPSSYERYGTYYDEGNRLLQELGEFDPPEDGPYRVEKTYNFLSPFRRIALNETLAFGYRGVALYDSAYDDRVQNFLFRLGYTPNRGVRTSYNDPMLVSDSLLGIKYVFSDEQPTGFVKSSITDSWDGGGLYANPYALGLGYGSSKDILEDVAFNGNPFDYQNEIVKALTGTSDDCLIAAKTRLVEKGDEAWTWEVDAPDDALLYGFFEYEYQLSIDLYEGDEYRYIYLNDWSQGMFPLTSTPANGTRTVTLKGEIPPYATDLIFHAAFVDKDVFEATQHKLAAQPFVFEAFEDGYVTGSYESNGNDVLFTTIPYDPGWTVKVNGIVVEPHIAQDAFIALDVVAGVNEIEMSYQSPGFIPGAAVSAGACVVFIVFAFTLRRRPVTAVSATREEAVMTEEHV